MEAYAEGYLAGYSHFEYNVPSKEGGSASDVAAIIEELEGEEMALEYQEGFNDGTTDAEEEDVSSEYDDRTLKKRKKKRMRRLRRKRRKMRQSPLTSQDVPLKHHWP